MTCTVPVYRLRRGPVHRLALADQRAALEADGWIVELVAFHAVPEGSTPPPPAPVDTTFSFAVIPDTQNETYAGEVRMQERVEWLLGESTEPRPAVGAAQRRRAQLGHPRPRPVRGDERVAAAAARRRVCRMSSLRATTTRRRCARAAAPVPDRTPSVALRDTSTWNAYYPPARFGFKGVFEAGKSDNGWRAFSAGGKRLAGPQPRAVAAHRRSSTGRGKSWPAIPTTTSSSSPTTSSTAMVVCRRATVATGPTAQRRCGTHSTTTRTS